jgi:hypothetical protein
MSLCANSSATVAQRSTSGITADLRLALIDCRCCVRRVRPSAASARVGTVRGVATKFGQRPGEFERATCHHLGHDLDHVVLQCVHP